MRARVIRFVDVQAGREPASQAKHDRWPTCLKCRTHVEEIEVFDEDKVDKSWLVVVRCHGEEDPRSLKRNLVERHPIGEPLLSVDPEWATGFAFHEYRTAITFVSAIGHPEPTAHEATCVRTAVESAVTAFVRHLTESGTADRPITAAQLQSLGRVATGALANVAIERFNIRFAAVFSAIVSHRSAPAVTMRHFEDGSTIIGHAGRSFVLSPEGTKESPNSHMLDALTYARARAGTTASPIANLLADREITALYQEAAEARWRLLGEILIVISKAWARDPALLELDAKNREPDFGDDDGPDDTAARFALLELK